MSTAVANMKDTFSAQGTMVQISSDEDVTGLERIMLSAQGDLQRLLSAFFAKPIHIKLIYANNHPSPKPSQPASPSNPRTQTRQVHLLCDGLPLCVATSKVTVTSPECARLFFEEKFPIGQMFRMLGRKPTFALTSIKASGSDKMVLERTYTLETEGILCEILEVFPDRAMFVQGASWLERQKVQMEEATEIVKPAKVVSMDASYVPHDSSLDSMPWQTLIRMLYFLIQAFIILRK